MGATIANGATLPVIRFLPLAALPLMSACVVATSAPEEPAGPPPAPPLPIEVIEALPPGAPTQTVILAPDGCYIFTVEVTDPPSGYPVRTPDGTPLCESNTSEPVFTNSYAGVAPPAQGNGALAGGTSLAPGTIPDLGT